jgi:hypothetical protein
MKERDDFLDWEAASIYYEHNMNAVERTNTMFLQCGDEFSIDENFIISMSGCAPIHSNWRSLYQVLLHLRPNSIFEVGFGFGNNLHNMKMFLPELRVGGIDVACRQFEIAKHRVPSLTEFLTVHDGRSPLPTKLHNSHDIAFTRGVITFICNHMDAIHNMFQVANKYVVLLENWSAHDFCQDIREYAESPQCAWHKVYMYYYYTPDHPENPGRPKIVVCSKEEINEEWLTPLLTDQDLR